MVRFWIDGGWCAAAVLGIVIVAVARGQFPMRPRTWLERREFAFARRWLAAHPPPPELLEAERELAEALRRWRP